METVIPDRLPDYSTSYGSCFWWHEMVYLGANGEKSNIIRDQDNGRIYITRNGRKAFLSDPLREQYDKWLYKDFEDAMDKSQDGS